MQRKKEEVKRKMNNDGLVVSEANLLVVSEANLLVVSEANLLVVSEANLLSLYL
jgi:hypothetical protein